MGFNSVSWNVSQVLVVYSCDLKFSPPGVVIFKNWKTSTKLSKPILLLVFLVQMVLLWNIRFSQNIVLFKNKEWKNLYWFALICVYHSCYKISFLRLYYKIYMGRIFFTPTPYSSMHNLYHHPVQGKEQVNCIITIFHSPSSDDQFTWSALPAADASGMPLSASMARCTLSPSGCLTSAATRTGTTACRRRRRRRSSATGAPAPAPGAAAPTGSPWRTRSVARRRWSTWTTAASPAGTTWPPSWSWSSQGSSPSAQTTTTTAMMAHRPLPDDDDLLLLLQTSRCRRHSMSRGLLMKPPLAELC